MIKKICVIFSIIISLVCGFSFNSNKVEATNNFTYEYIKDEKGNKIGYIKIYDNFLVDVYSKYGAKNVNLTIKNNSYPDAEPFLYVNRQDFHENKLNTFYILNICKNNNFELFENESYNVYVEVEIKTDNSATNSYVYLAAQRNLILNDDNINSNKEEHSERDEKYEEKILSGSQKIKNIFLCYVIPIGYLVLFIVMIIKSLLLSIDLIKYADVPDVRNNKIRSYVYVSIGFLILLVLNTFGGFYTGLFG